MTVTKFNGNGLISLTEKILGQPNMDYLWLLVVILCRSRVKRRKWGKKKHKMYILKRIGAPENVKLGPKLVLK